MEINMQIDFAESQLVYLVYGNDEAYLHEAKFSILSAIRESKEGSLTRILLYTDKPHDFLGWPVDIVYLSDEIMKAWIGFHGYFHRCKAAAILDSTNYANYSIFVDTDTFFVQDPSKLFDLLKSKKWIVDEVEAVWADWHDQPLYQKTASMLLNKYSVADDLLLINSGIFGIKNDAKDFMHKSIKLIDEIYPLAKNIHIVEQFAASVAAYGFTRPGEARGIVRHYYSEKLYWRSMLKEFFEVNDDNFSSSLILASKSFPQKKPKPSYFKRLKFRFYTAGLSVKKKRALRFFYYAANLPMQKYRKSCSLAYIKHFLESYSNENNPMDLFDVIKLRPLLFSRKDINYLTSILSLIDRKN